MFSSKHKHYHINYEMNNNKIIWISPQNSLPFSHLSSPHTLVYLANIKIWAQINDNLKKYINNWLYIYSKFQIQPYRSLLCSLSILRIFVWSLKTERTQQLPINQGNSAREKDDDIHLVSFTPFHGFSMSNTPAAFCAANYFSFITVEL